MQKIYSKISLFILAIFSLLSFQLTAQITAGGTPISFEQASKFQEPRNIVIPSVDIEKVKKEDKEVHGTTRFAVAINVNYDLQNAGEWTNLENGDRVWRMKITSSNANGLFFLYKNMFLPNGAKLYMYNESRTQIFGAYTNRNNKKSGKFMTGMVDGETAIVEYYEPKSVYGQGRLQIFQVMHAYRSNPVAISDYEFQVRSGNQLAGFDDALSCHVNINCPEGNDWQEEKKGIARIWRVFATGMGGCTGTLINNTNNDGTPYVLSAFHCTVQLPDPDFDLWRFDFNYEAAGCSNPGTEPTYQSIVGCTFLAGREQSDFSLLELSTDIPSNFNVQFNGWDRSDTAIPSNSAIIHHPRADIKKISIDNDAAIIQPTSIDWDNNVITPPDHHFRVILDEGTMESGSSGCPLFNQDGLVVGQLHGGNASCTQFVTFHGRFSKSWDEGTTANSRLQDWLDPNNTGVTTLGTYTPPAVTTASISGNIKTPDADNMANVKVYIVGGTINDSTMTNSAGDFSFGNIPVGTDYTITPSKSGSDHDNGISGNDVVEIQKHLLQINLLDDVYDALAADANASNSISAGDVLFIRRVFQFIWPEFIASPAWRFISADYQVDDITKPYTASAGTVDAIQITNLQSNQDDIDFIGVKIGDVNDTADSDN